MNERDVVIAGGGAAGMFAAIVCAETTPGLRITVLEKSSHFLSKVRISGGGRCNVTHSCFEPRELSRFYPRGGSALRGPFHTFQARDTITWFESHGVRLKTEEDGRMFPITDSSETIIDCLLNAASWHKIELLTNSGLEKIEKSGEKFILTVTGGREFSSRCVMLATGGCRSAAAGTLAVSLGHQLVAPVPSLFTFHIEVPWIREIAGIAVPDAEVSVPDFKLRERGPVLMTHVGLSGPGILRVSAWGARELNGVNYKFLLHVNWLPNLTHEALGAHLEHRRAEQPAKLVVNAPIHPLPARLWERLVLASGLSRETRCAELSRAAKHQLIQQLTGSIFQVTGKTLNQDEFVTCGGVCLSEVQFKTMESKLCPNLFFGGELLDIDGLTGGFNFQAAWTTGWLAGKAMAARLAESA